MTGRIVPVVMSGGAGARLWPLSRINWPKPFLKIAGDASLLQQAGRRALSVSGAMPEDLVTVTTAALAYETARQYRQIHPGLCLRIIKEPRARGTAAAMALAALTVSDAFGQDALMLVFPADHHVQDDAALATAVAAGRAAAARGAIITFGIRPSRLETGYGYIQPGGAIEDAPGVWHVESFVEKPDAASAEAMAAEGRHLWNAGIFLARAGSVIEAFAQYAPEVLSAVKSARVGPVSLSPALYDRVPKEAFEASVMMRARNVAVVPCDPGWSDLGTWESLWDRAPKDKDGNGAAGDAVFVQSRNCFSYGAERLIVCAGVEHLVIVETPDALLVADRRNPESIKSVVEALQAAGRPELMAHFMRLHQDSAFAA